MSRVRIERGGRVTAAQITLWELGLARLAEPKYRRAQSLPPTVRLN
jgi:hypothetical protein